MKMSGSQLGNSPTRLTIGVLCYNQEAFIGEAVRSALDQIYSPLEVVISDDASTDGSFAVIQRLVEEYDGPHQVVLNRNQANLGVAGNVNRVMELATGEIIMIAGGDDISMRHRASRSAELLDIETDCSSVSFDLIRFEGPEVPLERESSPVGICTTRHTMSDYVAIPFFHLNGTRAFRRQVFDVFGPIAVDCPTEDSVIMLRCILLGDVLSTPEPQVYYRVHAGGLSQFENKYLFDVEAIHGQYLRDLALAAKKDLISEEELRRLTAILELRLERRTLQQDLHFAPNRIAVLKIIAASKAYRDRRKARMFVGALRPWKRY